MSETEKPAFANSPKRLLSLPNELLEQVATELVSDDPLASERHLRHLRHTNKRLNTIARTPRLQRFSERLERLQSVATNIYNAAVSENGIRPLPSAAEQVMAAGPVLKFQTPDVQEAFVDEILSNVNSLARAESILAATLHMASIDGRDSTRLVEGALEVIKLSPNRKYDPDDYAKDYAWTAIATLIKGGFLPEEYKKSLDKKLPNLKLTPFNQAHVNDIRAKIRDREDAIAKGNDLKPADDISDSIQQAAEKFDAIQTRIDEAAHGPNFDEYGEVVFDDIESDRLLSLTPVARAVNEQYNLARELLKNGDRSRGRDVDSGR